MPGCLTTCRQCTRPASPTVDTTVEVSDQQFDAESLGDSEHADLVLIQSGEDWVAQLDLSRRPFGQANFSVSPLYNSRIPPVSHCWSGSGQILFPLGRRLSHCTRSYYFCGTTGIICQRTWMEWCGGREVPIVRPSQPYLSTDDWSTVGPEQGQRPCVEMQ